MTYDAVLAEVQRAVADGLLTPPAAANIAAWLTEPRYSAYAEQVADHVRQRQWTTLDDVFWTVIPFGTGGRRGKMYPIGSNAINERTIGESAQGLARYVKDYVRATLGPDAPLTCAIAYDTRHRSADFARLCAEIMTANGFRVYFLAGYRSTPELSFCVRYKGCSCGIMVTASHNPPSDNAVKAYWSTGGQLLPPHDQGVIERVMSVDAIPRLPFDEQVASGSIVLCQEDVDEAYVAATAGLSTPGPRDLRVVYSPLHGVGASAVCPILERAGFRHVELFARHAEPNGDFPNVPGNVSNPENAEVFDSIIAHAAHAGADLALATDPDCDRIGCASPIVFSADSGWKTLTGNQIGALLADYVLETWAKAGKLSARRYLVQTLVTTQLTRRIAESYGIRTIGDLLVGFKWIAGAIDEQGPEEFVFGAEESHGYLYGLHVRDKDAGGAALLLCELAAQLKSRGMTLHEKLDALFWQHGVHAERTVSVQMPGSEGMARMKQTMARLRTNPPASLCGSPVAAVRDYFSQQRRSADGSLTPLEGPRGDLVILDLKATGNYVAVRPSGTEPKIKLYLFAYEPPEQLADLDDSKGAMAERLNAMEDDMRRLAGV